ncbi:MAG: tyrosine-type recombinase/integrase, partial [Mycolicibacterium sp.]|nr:tyrosine-type recombinase/integrase [Mycolicibacterium sp.]
LDGCATQTGQQWSGPPSGLRDRLLFATLAETGMRLGEALSLRHHDFHIGAGATPYIDVAARQDHPRGARGKTLRARRIYIGDDLEALYSSYVWHLVDHGADLAVPDLDTHFVFVNLTTGVRFAPMRPETVYAKVDSLTKKSAGVLPDGWSPHWLRHSHATALLLSGVAPHVVMRRLGHADIQTTLSTYGWVTEDAEMRTLAQWKNYVAGWKGLHHDDSD